MSFADEERPLADRLRPVTLDEFVGQAHLVGANKPLARLAVDGRLHSMILWGPPGTGKTTLARLLSANADAHWLSLSAVMSGVKEVRAAVAEAQAMKAAGRATVLFVDEVHRFNKAQQDAFLPHVEDGTITLIGATTENPSFELNAALLSRARVYVLRPLTPDDLASLLDRALTVESAGPVSDAVRDLLIDVADGDARRLLNLLELALQLSPEGLTVEGVTEALGERQRRFDKGGDEFYEQISALHKSVRGSAPDAALYWFCRMLDGGADPRYLARRLVRMASEDVGNADPRALQLAIAATETFERLGSPEGELALAQCVLYLASVPKSNAVYMAFNAATAWVKESSSDPVPMHLRNASTGLARELGYGHKYRYAHDEPDAYAAGEQYFPDGVNPPTFYEPANAGLEIRIRERLERLAGQDAAARTAKGNTQATPGNSDKPGNSGNSGNKPGNKPGNNSGNTSGNKKVGQ